MSGRRLASMYAVLASIFVSSLAPAAIPDARFSETTVLGSGIGQATGVARPPDGSNRLFIITKGGNVRVYQDGALISQAFATLTPIYAGSECGLVGIAFDPDYATNHYVYFFVTRSSSEQQIVRYTDNNNQGMDMTPIVTGLPTIGANHDGGGIGFGPDGNIYWSIGDLGAGEGTGANLTSLASKVGRATPLGEVPADNPYVDGPGGNNDYIWARGFRNPFTLTFEPGRGRLWLNVVGSQFEQIFVVGAGEHGGWSGFENTQPANYIPPVIKYRTNGSDVRNIAASGVVRMNNILTINTVMAHGFRRGERITLAGISDARLNGTVFVDSIVSPMSFTASSPGPDISSGGGQAISPEIGGCVTGGTFYDATDFPAEFRGNFFFGDYNSDNLMRTVVDGNGDVASVDFFGSGINSVVDMEVGPDGALYTLGHGGQLRRVAFAHSTQALVISARNARLVEGGRFGFSVRLAMEPAGNVVVDVRNTGGDPDVTVEDGAQLTFTAANWNQPQPVMLFAGLDFDSSDDASTISVESAGLTAETLSITVRDNNTQSIVLSATMLEVPEGSASEFSVSLSDMPAANVTLSVSSTSADILIAGGDSLTFTPQNYSTAQTVTIAGFEDADANDAVARVRVSGTDVAARTVRVLVRDNDASPPSFISTPAATAVVGSAYTYDAEAMGLPAPTFVLDVSPSGVVFDRNAGTISYLPQAPGSYDFTLRATNGIMPDAIQTWTVIAATDARPAVMLVKPEEGAVLSGNMEQWYGTATDDVGLVRADFIVDGVVVNSQHGAMGRYDFGGAANSFDTTPLANGPVVLRMEVFDTAGQSAFAEVNVRIDNAGGTRDGGGVVTPPPPPPGGTMTDGGCGCAATGRQSDASPAILLLMALIWFGRSRGRTGS